MLKKPNILVVGSFMMDLIASTKRAPNSGETVIGLKFQTAPGGKGANQAVQCARLGAHVTMVGQVGDDAFGKIMTDTAAAAGVDVSHVSVDPQESSGVGHITLEVTEHGAQNRITVCPGANFTITVDDVAWLREEIGRFDLVMMQFELPMEVIEAVAQWAHDAGVPVMINPAPAAPMSTGCSPAPPTSPPTSTRPPSWPATPSTSPTASTWRTWPWSPRPSRPGGWRTCIITMGENGSIAAGKNGIHHTHCVKMEHVADPTAAGDSFVAAFCTGLTAGLPQGEALAFASHTAAITVSRMGAMPSLPTVEEVQQLLVERDYQGFDPAELDALKQ